MGKDVHDDGEPCCHACERYAGGAVPEPMVERAALEVPTPARIKLIVRSARSGAVLHEHVPTKPEIWVGRGSANDIPLRSSNVSRRQTMFAFRDGGVFVMDGKSSCGTYLDGRLIHNAVRVGAGSVVSFADYEVVLATEAPGQK